MNKMAKPGKGEKDLIESYEKNEWRSVKGKEERLKQYTKYARNTMRKDQRINIRISQKDLESLQVKAREDGIPYQTLISSVLHKFVSGRLIQKY